MIRILSSALFVTVLLSHSVFSAEPVARSVTPQKLAAPGSPAITDVVLDSQGSLTGTIVSRNGLPVAGKAVTVSQGRKTLGSTKTSGKGQFQVSGLRPGVYQITAGDETSVVRAWTPEAAPPKARKMALLVQGQPVVRGQLEMAGMGPGLATGATLAVGAATIGIGVANGEEIDDTQTEISRLNKQVQDIDNKVDDIQESIADL